MKSQHIKKYNQNTKSLFLGLFLAAFGCLGLFKTASAGTIYSSEISIGKKSIFEDSRYVKRRYKNKTSSQFRDHSRRLLTSVTLYRACDYDSKPISLPIGEYRDTAYLAKAAQNFGSIVVPRGMKIVTFSGHNFNGKKRVFRDSVACFDRGERFHIGSIKVKPQRAYQSREMAPKRPGDHGYGWSTDTLAGHYYRERARKRAKNGYMDHYQPSPYANRRHCETYTVIASGGRAKLNVVGKSQTYRLNGGYYDDQYSGKVCSGNNVYLKLSKRHFETKVRVMFKGRVFVFAGGEPKADGWYRKEFRLSL